MNAPAKITLEREDRRTGHAMRISLPAIPGTLAPATAPRKTPLELHQEARIPTADITRPAVITPQRPRITADRLALSLTRPMTVHELAEVIGESARRTGKALWDAQRSGHVISRKTRGPTVWARPGATIYTQAYAPAKTAVAIVADIAERDARLIALIRSGVSTVVQLTGETGWSENAIRRDLARLEALGTVTARRTGGHGTKLFEVPQ